MFKVLFNSLKLTFGLFIAAALLQVIPVQAAFDMGYGYTRTFGAPNSGSSCTTNFCPADGLNKISIDSSGNVYSVGYNGKNNAGAISLNTTGTGSAYTVVPVAWGSGFLLKYDTAGTWQWGTTINPSGATSGSRIMTSTTDSAGNVYFVALSNGTSYSLVKLTSAGAQTFSVGIPVGGYYAIFVDSAGNIYLGGQGNSTGGLIAKYNSSGTNIWSRTLGTDINNRYLSITQDAAGNMYFAGQTYATSNYNPFGGTADSKTKGAFVTKLDSAGTYQWTNVVNTPFVGMDLDSAGNIYMAYGTYLRKYDSSMNQLYSVSYAACASPTERAFFLDKVNTKIYIGGSASAACNMNPSGSDVTATGGGYVSKYNDDGTYNYSYVVKSVTQNYVTAIAVDSNNNLYFGGQYNGSTNFNATGSGAADTKTSNGSGTSYTDNYIQKLSPVGHKVSAIAAGLTPYLSSDWSTSLLITSGIGVNNVGIANATYKIASLDADFTTADLSWSNVIGDSSSNKAIFGYSTGFSNIPGRNSSTYTLYVPKTVAGIRLGFCGSATNLTEINTSCNGLQYIAAPGSATIGSDSVVITEGSGAYSAYWVVAGLSVNMGAFESEGYTVQPTTLPANTNVVLASSPSTDLTSTGVSGTQTVQFQTNSDAPIADIPLNFSSDINLSTLTIETSSTASLVHVSGGITALPGVPALSTYTLYVPKGMGDQVRVCPGASSLAQVTINCSGGFTLGNGGSYGGVSVTIDGDYWKISGLTGTGAMSLITGSLSDTMDRLAISTASNHEITFATNYGLTATGHNFTIEFDPANHVFDLTGLDYSDIELSDGTVKTLAALADVNTWGVAVAGDIITFTAPTSGTGYILGATQITVKIGLNVIAGAVQIINPATSGVYSEIIFVTNTQTEEGVIAVPIVDSDRVNVTSYINTFINFDIDTAVADLDCDFDACNYFGDAGATAGNYTVDLGELTSIAVNKSNSGSVTHTSGSGVINSIYFDLTTNAANGAIVTVTSSNGGLESAGIANNRIESVTSGQDIAANSGSYGYQMPLGNTGNGTIETNAACTETLYCALTTGQTTVFTTDALPLDNGRIRMDIAAAAAYTNNPGSYTDTLTFVAVATF